MRAGVQAGGQASCAHRGRPVARPIVVGLAARRVAGRVPVAEIKHHFAKKFAQLRQLGCAIQAGVEIVYHSTVLACDHLDALADGDNAEMPSPIQLDFNQERLQQH